MFVKFALLLSLPIWSVVAVSTPVFVNVGPAVLATLTVSVMLAVAPTAKAEFSVQLSEGILSQVHPLPLNPVAVKPLGRLSVT
jgi:hypothetical protein